MGKTINYLAFGDSLTAGYGAPHEHDFASLYRKKAEDILGIPVHLYNAGRNGATTAQLLDTLEKDLCLQQHVREADLITVTAGGNDLIQAAIPYFYQGDPQLLKTALQIYESNYKQIVGRIVELKEENCTAQSPYLIALIGLYNPLPQVPDADYWVQRFNLCLRKLEKPNIRVVQVYEAFIGKDEQVLAEDHIHPNDAGYVILAEQVEQAVPLHRLQHKA